MNVQTIIGRKLIDIAEWVEPHELHLTLAWERYAREPESETRLEQLKATTKSYNDIVEKHMKKVAILLRQDPAHLSRVFKPQGDTGLHFRGLASEYLRTAARYLTMDPAKWRERGWDGPRWHPPTPISTPANDLIIVADPLPTRHAPRAA
jgi:hypothetical protein